MRRGQYSIRQRPEAPRRWKITDLVPPEPPAGGELGTPRPALRRAILRVAVAAAVVCAALALYPLVWERTVNPCIALERAATRRGIAIIREPVQGGPTALVVPEAGRARPQDRLRCMANYWWSM